MEPQLKLSTNEKELENKKLLDVIEFLPDATFVIDLNHKIIAWNKEVEIMTGIKKEEMIGKGNKNYSRAFYNNQRPLLADLVLQNKKIDPKLYSVFRREGQSFYVETFVPKFYGGKGGYAWAKASPFFDTKGKVIGVIESTRDITDKKIFEESLRNSEKKYREFTDSLPQIVFEADVTGKIIFINSMVLEQLGYTKAEVIEKMNIVQFLDTDQIDLAKRLFANRLRGKPMTCTVFKIVKKNGDKFLVNIYTSVIKDEKNKTLGLRGVVVDVTEQQKYAEKLKKSEEKYHSLFELSPDAVGVITNNKITFANMAMVNLLGAKKREQIIGKDILDFIKVSMRMYVSKKIKEMFENNLKMPLIEEHLIKLNGKIVQVELTANSLNDGEENSAQIVIRDISQRKKVEENLQKLYFESSIERQKMEAVMNSMGDAVFALDKNKKIILVNPIAMELIGMEKNKIIGKKYNKMYKFILEKEGTEITDFIDEIYKEGKTTSISDRTVLVNKNGELIPVSDSAAPIKDNQGKVIGCVVIFRDVTRERKIDRAKSEFVSVASHQLRTPLSAIKWFLELLTSEVAGQLSDEQKQYLNQIIASNDRMIRLVNELLSASRLETGNLTVRKKMTNLNLIVKEAFDEILPKTLEKKQKFTLETDTPLPINSDTVILKQIIDNLITNANRYTPSMGTINVRTYAKDNQAVFEVKDNGYGIPENQKEKLFSKFFRADNIITKQTDGTGLGLYVVKSAIETLGGKVWFESEENKGSTFYFSLPLDKQLSMD